MYKINYTRARSTLQSVYGSRLKRQGVQRIADELVDEGLALYADNPRHKRSKLFGVTDPGRSVLAQIQDGHAAWLRELTGGAPDVDWSSLRTELETLATSLRDRP